MFELWEPAMKEQPTMKKAVTGWSRQLALALALVLVAACVDTRPTGPGPESPDEPGDADLRADSAFVLRG